MNLRLSRHLVSLSLLFIGLEITTVMAAPPTQEDVNVYAGLCKTGSVSKYDVSAEAGLISRRLLSGAAKLSAESLKDEFPAIKDEKNRVILIQAFQDCVILIQAFQDCMYRYVERFHPQIDPKADPASPSPQLAPSIPPERRREIVFLANQIEDFKKIMEKTIERVPERYNVITTHKIPPRNSPGRILTYWI